MFECQECFDSKNTSSELNHSDFTTKELAVALRTLNNAKAISDMNSVASVEIFSEYSNTKNVFSTNNFTGNISDGLTPESSVSNQNSAMGNSEDTLEDFIASIFDFEDLADDVIDCQDTY